MSNRVPPCLSGCAVALLMTAAAQAQVLPNCTIDFDGTCPDAAAVCGASFACDGTPGDCAAATCDSIGVFNCYSSGLFSYRVTPDAPLNITFSDNLTSVRTFFAEQGPDVSGEVRFFDAEVGGNEVGSPLNTNGNCVAFMPTLQTVSLPAAVRRIEVTATGGTLWIDDFQTNPLTADCAGVSNCSGNGTCIGQDVCLCDNGFEGPDCSQMSQVPTLSEWGLMAMLAVLLAGGAAVISRRRARLA